LVLATPLTVCLVVLGRHVERLEFLDVMFGDRPALSPPEIFYQRMLAGDPTEAADKAEEFLKEQSLSSYYDEVALKGLLLAQADAERGVLSYERLTKIRDAVSELVDNLEDSCERPPTPDTVSDPEASSAVESTTVNPQTEDTPILQPEDLPPGWQEVTPVLCIAGRSLIDEAAAIMLSQLTAAHGLKARTEGPEALSTTNVFRLQTAGVAIICLVYMDASAPAHMRYSVRRLRRKFPKGIIILACCKNGTDGDILESLRENTRADKAAGSLTEVTRFCVDAVRRPGFSSGGETKSSVVNTVA
jgi:hypothetical protein